MHEILKETLLGFYDYGLLGILREGIRITGTKFLINLRDIIFFNIGILII